MISLHTGEELESISKFFYYQFHITLHTINPTTSFK